MPNFPFYFSNLEYYEAYVMVYPFTKHIFSGTQKIVGNHRLCIIFAQILHNPRLIIRFSAVVMLRCFTSLAPDSVKQKIRQKSLFFSQKQPNFQLLLPFSAD